MVFTGLTGALGRADGSLSWGRFVEPLPDYTWCITLCYVNGYDLFHFDGATAMCTCCKYRT